MDLVENYARKSKWAWVSEDIKEEAKQNALVKLVKGVLKYDPEAKKSSAFSYCTTFCERAFIDALNDNAKRLERNAIIERELTMIWTPSHGRKIGVPARESSDGMDGFGN